MKLRLASLDVRIAHVHGVGVAVHKHDRFVSVTAEELTFSTGAVRKDDEYCAVLYVVLQLPLLLLANFNSSRVITH